MLPKRFSKFDKDTLCSFFFAIVAKFVDLTGKSISVGNKKNILKMRLIGVKIRTMFFHLSDPED